MSTNPTKASDAETETIEMLDTLGYLRNSSEIWTMVSKDFDLSAAQPFSSLDFECRKPGESPFEILPGRVIQRLADEGYVKAVTRLAGNNANNQLLFIQLEPKGERWYLQECPRWERSRLHHEPAAST
jgi:hypothetical protein